MPKMPTQSWMLADAEERAKRRPDSFRIPHVVARRNVPVGAYVKLIFLNRRLDWEHDVCELAAIDNFIPGERMWVRVTDRTAVGFLGILDNSPEFIDGLKVRDVITFGPEHIADITER